MEKHKKCCFIGHRIIEINSEQKEKLKNFVEDLIVSKGVYTFLFGSRSKFDNLCHELVTELGQKYPHISRVYVRAEYSEISEEYENYLLQFYEESYFPISIKGAGRAVYVERNMHMIDNSEYCIFYYDTNNTLKNSGTKKAYDYAMRKKKKVINVY